MRKLRHSYPRTYNYLKNGYEFKPRQLDFHSYVLNHYSNCLLFVAGEDNNYKDDVHKTL